MPATSQIIIGLVALAMLIAAVGILIHILRTGVLTARAFANTPVREGSLSLGDIVITVGLWLCAMMAAQAIGKGMGLAPADRDAVTPQEMLRVVLLGQATMGVAVVFVLVRAHAAVRGGIAGFGLGVRRLGAGLKAGLVGICAMLPLVLLTSATVGLLLKALGHEPPQIAHELLKSLIDEPWGLTRVGLIVSAVLIAPAVEEVLFRGMIQTGLQQSGAVKSRWAVIVLTSVMFAAIHASVAAPEALPTLFVLSLGLGYVYEKSGSLWSDILLHALFNASQIAIALNVPRDLPV